MSDDYTRTPSPHPSPFGALIFSLEQQLKRENYTPAHHYTPFRGTQEMSDKLRYE